MPTQYASTHLVLPGTDSFDNQNDYLHHQYHQINNLTDSHFVSPPVRHGLRRGSNRKGITSFKKRRYSLYSNRRKFRNRRFRLDPRQEVKQLPRFLPGFLSNCWLESHASASRYILYECIFVCRNYTQAD